MFFSRLNKEAINAVNWFEINSMVANPAKFQLLFIGLKNINNVYMTIGGNKVPATNSVKLLGIHIDSNLKFDGHIKNICSKARSKCFALSRIRNYLSLDKAILLYNSFILSNFSYCPLIWMFCSKKENNLINEVHKKALRIVYKEPNKTLNRLLDLDGSSGVHLRNLRYLMIEVFKSLNKLNPKFMWNLFHVKEFPMGLRNERILVLPSGNTKSKGTNTIMYRACSLWNSVENNIMCANNLENFKKGILKWNGKRCSCKLCR